MRSFPLLLAVVLLGSCTDPDTMAPTISLTDLAPTPTTATICGSLENNMVPISSDDTFRFTLGLTDDRELSQYKIDLHSNFDCHGHARVATTDWYVINIEDVTGTEQIIPVAIPVPTNVTAGTYHFQVRASDAAGNESQSGIYALVVLNADDQEAPLLTVTEPSVNSISVQKGTDLTFVGTLTDNEALGADDNGRIQVRYWSTSNNTISQLYLGVLDASVGTTHLFNFDATIPTTLPDGSYIFEVRAFDAVNNPSNVHQISVQID